MYKNLIIFLELFVIIALLYGKDWKLILKAKWLILYSKFLIWWNQTKLYLYIKVKYKTISDTEKKIFNDLSNISDINLKDPFSIRTSKEWFDSIPKEWRIILSDKAGWDNSNLLKTFYQDKITKEEFINRCKQSQLYFIDQATNKDLFYNGDW